MNVPKYRFWTRIFHIYTGFLYKLIWRKISSSLRGYLRFCMFLGVRWIPAAYEWEYRRLLSNRCSYCKEILEIVYTIWWIGYFGCIPAGNANDRRWCYWIRKRNGLLSIYRSINHRKGKCFRVIRLFNVQKDINHSVHKIRRRQFIVVGE